MTKSKSSHANYAKDRSNGFMVDGYERAVEGIEAEVRAEINEKYADEWNVSSLTERQSLAQKIDEEVMALVDERSREISPDALF